MDETTNNLEAGVRDEEPRPGPAHVDIRDLEWSCSCGETRPPSHGNYVSLTMNNKHKKHRIRLVNKLTGEVVAGSRPEAMAKNIPLMRKIDLVAPDLKKRPAAAPEPTPVPEGATDTRSKVRELEPEPEVDDPVDEVETDEFEMQATEFTIEADGVFRVEVILPADAFTLFNMAKGLGLDRRDITFNEWIWGCILKRYETDYRMQLIMAPLAQDW